MHSCDKANNWTFTYMGCSRRNALSMANKYAIPVSNVSSLNFASPEAMKSAGSSHKSATSNFIRSCKMDSTFSKSGFYESGTPDCLLQVDSPIDLQSVATSHLQVDSPMSFKSINNKIDSSLEVNCSSTPQELAKSLPKGKINNYIKNNPNEVVWN